MKIVCPKCGMVSYNPNDVEKRYCGHCHAFHEDFVFMSEIITSEPSEDGGFTMTLACGHTVWLAVEGQVKGNRMYCSSCLNNWVERETKQHPTPRS